MRILDQSLFDNAKVRGEQGEQVASRNEKLKIKN
jgi:hypothetical protein